MAHSYHHSVSSAKKHGGKPEDYLQIHNFLDSSKQNYCSWKHRAILHNSFGVFLAEKVFGVTIKNSNGKEIPVRIIAEEHIREDLSFIPTVENWLKDIPHENWMTKNVDKNIQNI